MKEFKYVITDPDGIHARPAGGLVKLAKGFDSKITIKAGGKSADAKKLFNLMGLGVPSGCEITVSLDGSDEDECAVKLEEYFTANL